MFKIEYYDAQSEDWYRYGDETFASVDAASDKIKLLYISDPCSRYKLLRVAKCSG